MNYVCGDNRFEIIEQYKNELISATNIESSPEEMAVLDNIIFRFWQMGWLKGQEAEWVYGEDETGVDGWHCSKCNFFEPWFYDFDDDIDFIKRYEHCPKCGRRMTSYTGKQEGW